jgi:hypothetical protein
MSNSSGANSTWYLFNNIITDCRYWTIVYSFSGYTVTIHNRNILTKTITSTVFYTRTDSAGTTTYTPITNATTATLNADGYHLDPSDTSAKDLWTNLSTDLVFAFNDDVDLNTRSWTWDIWADEYISVSNLLKIINYVLWANIKKINNVAQANLKKVNTKATS